MIDQTLFKVRRARVEDAGGIARVLVRAWQVAYRGLVPDALDGADGRGVCPPGKPRDDIADIPSTVVGP